MAHQATLKRFQDATARLTGLESRLAKIHEYFAWQARDGDWYGMSLNGEEVARLAELSAPLASEGHA